MNDWETVALVALVLGFLPVAIIAWIIVQTVAIIVLVIAFFWLLSQPISAWLFVISFAFNAVVLIPLWIVSWLAARYEPDLWIGAATHVYVFSGAFVLPTIIFYVIWQRASDEDSGS